MGWLGNQYLRRSEVYTSAREYGGGKLAAGSPLPASYQDNPASAYHDNFASSYQDNSAFAFQDSFASLGVWIWQSLTRFYWFLFSPK